jgi:hypothetical protein
MATFSQWQARQPVRRIAWVCGPEEVLRSEVVRAYRNAVPSASTTLLFTGELPEYQVWDQVLSYPLSAGRLIVVHGAERLRDYGSFEVLAEAEGFDTAFTVFVSSDKDFAKGEDGKALAPHLAALKGCKDAQLVRCARPSRDEDLLKLVASWWPGAGSNFAHALFTRCGGDLAIAREACLKAELAGLPPAPESIEYVVTEPPALAYIEALLSGDRRSAAYAAGFMQKNEVGYALAVLWDRLGQLAALREAKARGMTGMEIATKLKLNRYVQHYLTPLAPGYTPEKVRACRKLLAVAELAHQAGAVAGVAEALAANW